MLFIGVRFFLCTKIAAITHINAKKTDLNTQQNDNLTQKDKVNSSLKIEIDLNRRKQ